MELADLVKEIDAFVGDDKAKAKEARDALRGSASGAKLLAQSLIDVGQGGKAAELQKKIDALTAERDEAVTARDEATEALAAERGAKPDVAKLEGELTAKWQKKVDELKGKLKDKDETLRGALRKGTLAKLVNKLSTAHGVDPEYAQEVLAAKYGANIEVQDDGSVVVKGLDGLPIDGDEDARMGALASEIRKSVNPRYILTNADSGGGVGSGGRSGTGYDPVREGTEMGKQEKARAVDNKLAFT